MKNLRKTKAKKVLSISIIIISIISFSAILYATNTVIANPTTITFEDKNLYDSIKKQLSAKKMSYNGNDVDKTIEISTNDVEKIEEFDLSTSTISNLSGLENFTNLTSINLSKNTIAVANPLTQLKKLEILNISENPINTEILSTISELTTLKQLNVANTQMNGDQLDYLKNLKSLETLTLASNNISAVEKISGLKSISKLDISVNTSFTDFTQVTSFKSLEELNVSGTGITTFDGIKNLTNLEKLYAADNKSITTTAGINPLFETQRVTVTDPETEKQVTVVEPFLNKLTVLNLSSIGITGKRPSISFSNIGKLTTLQELHLASNDINNISGVTNLVHLNYLDLKYNKLTTNSIQSLIQKKNNEVVQSDTLLAEKIDLRGNEIVDISIFNSYPANIRWLDLSENHIYDVEPIRKHSCSQALYLQDQDITFGLYNKTANVDHYIILPTIFTYSKDSSKFIYSKDAEYEYTDGVTLNPDYTDPEEYNVRISHAKTSKDEIAVTLHGGVADGTVLHFKIGSTGNVNSLIYSLLFKDENLNTAIYNKLIATNQIKYLTNVPLIINVNRDAIDAIKELNLQHTGSSAETKIKDLTGLENFYNLPVLYLQNNDVSTIEQLATCTKLQTLNLASNSNIKDNNQSLSKLTALSTLNLSNTGMTNINSLNELIATKKNKMAVLDLSDNGLNNIDGLEQLTTLQSLSIANEKLTDENISKLSVLTNLTTLNMNGNQIENIDVLQGLDQLKYLYFNNNKVGNLEPLKGKVFYELEFTGNKIKDISPLSSHRTINNLKMDNNQIEDVSILSRISMTNEQNLSATGQKIVRILDSGASGKVTIPLPQIFKASQESGNKVYSGTDLLLTKCELDKNHENVIIDADALNGEVAQVEIISGNAKGTTLTVSAPLKATITYTPGNDRKTNQNITATISFVNDGDREIKITNNDGKNTYTFEQNGEFTFEFVDKYGIEGSATAKVQNIDKVAPVATVTQVRKDGNVEVTITVDEKVADVEGWTLTELDDGKFKLTKRYSEDANEDVKLVDEAGNTSTININVTVQANDIITSTSLKISEEELIIRGINPKLTVANFKNSIKSDMEYQILNKNGVAITNTDKVGTGCKIKMQSGKTYTIIVWGDLDGDGQISLAELAKISKIGVNKVTPSDLEKSAIDMNMNGKIELSELAAIAKLQIK